MRRRISLMSTTVLSRRPDRSRRLHGAQKPASGSGRRFRRNSVPVGFDGHGISRSRRWRPVLNRMLDEIVQDGAAVNQDGSLPRRSPEPDGARLIRRRPIHSMRIGMLEATPPSGRAV